MIEGAVTVGYLHPGTISHSFSLSLLDVIMLDLAGEQRLFRHDRWRYANECGSNGIVTGRNEIAAKMCDDSQAEWLFMVDSDMAFGPTIIEDLIATAEAPTDAIRKVVGALCFASKTDGRKEFDVIRYRSMPTIYDFVEGGLQTGVLPRLDYERDAVQKCAATGGAAVLIHRSVFEDMRVEFGPEWFTPVRHKSGVTFSEDLSFFLRCAGISTDVFVDTSIKTAHHKGDLWLDEAHYDMERAARSDGSARSVRADPKGPMPKVPNPSSPR